MNSTSPRRNRLTTPIMALAFVLLATLSATAENEAAFALTDDEKAPELTE